jgi:hypothetical protein
MLAVYPVKGFGIKAGAQFGFLLNAKEGDHDVKDLYKKSEFSIPVGLSYEFEETSIDLRYNIGLSNLVNSDYAINKDQKMHNCVIMLTIGYKIQL